MRRPMVIAGVVGGLLAVATLVIIVISATAAMAEQCEVCVTYRGQTQCREAAGSTQKEAIRTATDNACAFLAGGMTASIECSNQRPDSVVCQP